MSLYPKELKPLVSADQLPLVKKVMLEAYQASTSEVEKRSIRTLCTELIGSPLETEKLLGAE